MSLTRAENALIDLIEKNCRDAKPDDNFIRQLNEAVRQGINPVENEDKIRFTDKGFIDAFRERVTLRSRPSPQIIFEICMALSAEGKNNTFTDVPLRTSHVFNHLYEKLVKERKFDLRVSDNVPEDINAINFQLMDYFEKKFGKEDGAKEAKQNLANCVLMKSITTFEKDLAKLALSSNQALQKQVDVVVKDLKEKPQVSQEYFDRSEAARRTESFERSLEKEKRKMDKEFMASTTPIAPRKLVEMKPKKSLSAVFFKKKDPSVDLKKGDGDKPQKTVSSPKPGRKPSGENK